MKLFLIGDSTMAERTNLEGPMRGWGQMLQPFLQSRVLVENHATSGRSSKSFIGEGRWQKVLEAIEPGDYVFIQFGHNDQKNQDPKRFTNPYTGYRRNLERFVRETRHKKGHPVLLTSIVRRKFNDEGVLLDTHGTYPLVTRMVADDLDVPFIDLQQLTEDLVIDWGVEKSKDLYVWVEAGNPHYPKGLKDNSHLSVAGGTEVSRLVAGALKQLESPLASYLKK